MLRYARQNVVVLLQVLGSVKALEEGVHRAATQHYQAVTTSVEQSQQATMQVCGCVHQPHLQSSCDSLLQFV
jgi:hypothetical protein